MTSELRIIRRHRRITRDWRFEIRVSKYGILYTYVQRLPSYVALLTILFSESGWDQVRYCTYEYYLAPCHTEDIGLGEILYAINLNDTPVFKMLIYYILSISLM